MQDVDVAFERDKMSAPRGLRADAVSTGAVGAGIGAVLGFMITPELGAPVGSVIGAVVGAGIGAWHSRTRH